MSETPYRIDLDSVRKAFPLWLEAPPVLVDFAAWLEGRTWRVLGELPNQIEAADAAPWATFQPRRELHKQGRRLQPKRKRLANTVKIDAIRYLGHRL